MEWESSTHYLFKFRLQLLAWEPVQSCSACLVVVEQASASSLRGSIWLASRPIYRPIGEWRTLWRQAVRFNLLVVWWTTSTNSWMVASICSSELFDSLTLNLSKFLLFDAAALSYRIFVISADYYLREAQHRVLKFFDGSKRRKKMRK